MSDPETLRVYDAKVADYFNLVKRDTPSRDLASFIAQFPAGAKVLDLGCGTGQASAMMRDAGLDVTAMDGSKGMVKMANKTFGLDVKHALFSDLDAVQTYHGIWASFSLLHAPKSEMPDHLSRIHRALMKKGHLHLGLKLGSGEKRDALGRLYAYYTEPELTGLLADAGFSIVNTRQGKTESLAGGIDPFIVINAHA